jgi:glutamate-1-semialdehyde 2,1-aminomutase
VTQQAPSVGEAPPSGAAAAEGLTLDPGEERKYRERTPRSRQHLEQMKRLIPTGHGGGMWYQLPYPILLTRGKDCWVWDVDGNRYLDLRIGDWVMILGHANERVQAAIEAQLPNGTQFGCPDWDLSYRMAELLIERMPSLERVRFLVSGTEANLLAMRLARARTGRMKVAKAQGSYHGHADLTVTGSSTTGIAPKKVGAGVVPTVVEELVEMPFNDPDGAEEVLEREADDIAAVLIEPVQGAAGMIAASRDYLQRLRDVTERLGIVLIFDEVVTFPIAYGGAQAYHGITPDLTTMSKAIGGGLPISAVGGKSELMDLLDPELHAGLAPVTSVSTFGGNLASLAAGIACLEQLTPEVHERIQAVGDRAREGVDELGRTYGVPLHSSGLGHLFGLHWAPERVVDFQTRMQNDRGKIVNLHLALMNEGYYQMSLGYFLISATHGEQEIDGFLAALDRSLHTLNYV